MPYWQRLFSTGYVDASGNRNINPSEESAIVSILSAGTFFGALFSPFLADRVGRRMGLLLSTWVFNLGVVLHTVATSIPLFLAGRFFAGLGVGLISAMSMNAIQTLETPKDHIANEDTRQFPSTSLRPRRNGSEASSWEPTSGQSLLACSSLP